MKLYATILCILLFGVSSAQNISRFFEEASVAQSSGDYTRAIELYLDIIESEYSIPEVFLKLGIAYMHNLQYDNAKEQFILVTTRYKNRYPEAFFWLAELHMLFNQNNHAKDLYKQYLSLKHSDPYMRAKATHELRKSSNPSEHISDIIFAYDTTFNPIQAYSLYEWNNTIIYNATYLIDSAISYSGFKGFEQHDSVLGNMLINMPYHISDFCVIDTDTILITIRKLEKNTLVPRVYYIARDSLEWNTPQPYLSPIFPETSASIHFQLVEHNTKEYLLFSSNRDNEFGNFDIWYCERSNNSFSSPQKIGSHINSKGNEISPFYDTISERLYFSSNWHTTIGGYDIFYVEGSFGNFAEPKNMGTPVNSSFNEYYFKIIDSIAYFTSNRKQKHLFEQSYFFNSRYTFRMFSASDEYESDSLSMIEPSKLALLEDSLLIFTLYFDNNEPNIQNDLPEFIALFEQYYSQKNSFIEQITEQYIGIQKQVYSNNISRFFTDASSQLQELLSVLEIIENSDFENYTIEISLQASTSTVGTFEANTLIANKRIEAVIASVIAYAPHASDSILQTIKSPRISSVRTQTHIPYELSEAQERFVRVTIHISKKL